MLPLIPTFEYDIFISYRHNDNRSGWVTEFVNALQEELASTIKNPVSIYFDRNTYDGLLETHNVDKSLEAKLKCLIFIPIISQTYCDTKSFAWQHEFVAFNKLVKEDQFGRDIKLSNGNVASRILPIKIHDLDADDKITIENQIGGVLRPIEFIYKEPGVNRPLKPLDSKSENQNKTDYKNQVNKVANAIKDLTNALVKKKDTAGEQKKSSPKQEKRPANRKIIFISTALLIAILTVLTYYLKQNKTEKTDPYAEILDRAEMYMEEGERFDDKRYYQNASEAIEKVLKMDSLNERALYLLTMASEKPDTEEYIIKKIFRANPDSKFGLLVRAGRLIGQRKFAPAITDLQQVEKLDPGNKDALRMLCYAYMVSGDYLNSYKYARKYEQMWGEGLHEILSDLYLALGDFDEAKKHLSLKRRAKEFSCSDIESLQRIYVCEGNFEKLEQATDSICALSKCEKCPYWMLRAKMHVGKFNDAARYVPAALKNYGPITWRYPAFVLQQAGKKDSAMILLRAEMKYDYERIADSLYRQSIPLYSLAAIHAMQGNARESLQWLRKYADKGFEFGSEWYIGHDPLFDEMQKDNEYFADFMQIVQKAQLKKTAIREKIRQLEEAN